MTYDVAVIGGGIVGLATAFQLSESNPARRIVVLEKESSVASHQTGRNSGVIHSGIYYRPDSLKAENCREGKKALVGFCEQHEITYEICGKVIVAVSSDEIPRLEAIYQRGVENGVACELIGRERLLELEPHCAGIRGIHVPDAGIVDYKGVSEVLSTVVQTREGEVRLNYEVRSVHASGDTVVLQSDADEVAARCVINCAGLQADLVGRLGGDIPEIQVVPFRGEYYELVPESRHLCKNLIYPVPDPAYPFLGVHFTRMYDGRVECGPSAIMAFAREGYSFGTFRLRDALEILSYRGFWKLARQHWRKGVSEVRQSLSKKYYLSTLQRLVPEVGIGDIVPAPAGVRAQALRPDGSMVEDFLIQRNGRVINVYNAASPAATACLNIGKVIASYADS